MKIRHNQRESEWASELFVQIQCHGGIKMFKFQRNLWIISLQHKRFLCLFFCSNFPVNSNGILDLWTINLMHGLDSWCAREWNQKKATQNKKSLIKKKNVTFCVFCFMQFNSRLHREKKCPFSCVISCEFRCRSFWIGVFVWMLCNCAFLFYLFYAHLSLFNSIL